MANTKITFDTETLKQLKQLAKRAHKKSLLPVLEYLKFDIDENNKVKVLVSDSDLFIEKEITPVEVVLGAHRSFLIPGKTIKATKQGKKGSLFSFEVIDSFQITFIDKGISKKINTTDYEEYPKIPSIDGFETLFALRYDTLTKLKAACLSASNSETRPILTTIRLIENKIISTDSHRLYISNHDGRVGNGDIVINQDIINAVVDCENEKHFFGVVKYHNENIIIQTIDAVYYQRMEPGNYPEVSRLIPSEYKTVFTVYDIEELKSLVDACYNLTKTSKNNVMSFKVEDNNTLLVSAKNQEDGQEVKGSIPISVNYIENGFNPSFSSKFILDAFKQLNINDKVTFNFTGHLKPFTVHGTSENTMALILPVKSH